MTEVASLLREHLILREFWKFLDPVFGIWTYKPGLLEQPNEYHRMPGGNWLVTQEEKHENNELAMITNNIDEIAYNSHE